MKKALTVARWEYVEKVKSKAFLIGLFLTPTLMIAMGVLPSVFANQPDNETHVIGIIDRSGLIAGEFTARMQSNYKLPGGQPNYIVRPLAVGTGIDLDTEVAAANRLVASGEIEGYCTITGGSPADSLVEYKAKSVGDFQIEWRIKDVISGILAERHAAAMGLDPAIVGKLKVPLSVQTVKLSKSGEEEGGGFGQVFLWAYVFLMMMFLLIMLSGQMLVRSVIEEKSNRIVEVLVSSCSPTELMAGKILGLSGLGFTQIAFWALIGAAVTVQFGATFVAPGQAALLVVYFVLGYLFYAAVFIGAGSPLTTEQAAQQVTSYLVIVLILPIALAFPAIRNPDALWLKILTFVPLLTPSMMALRIPIQMPSLWEILGTITVMIVSIYGAMVAAGRIFRLAILSTGKSPRIGEIIRWVRTG